MTHICYKENNLCCEDVLLADLAEEYGTPLYVYSKNQFLENFHTLETALGEGDHRVCYALKANANPAILKLLAEHNAGADVVSGGELFLALKAGFSPDRIAFAGVGKREDEIEYALKNNVAFLNVESIPELQLVSRVALRLNTTARVALRINPDIDAQSHPYITTGLSENKFGIAAPKAMEAFTYAASLPSVEVRGIHVHIGSQITSAEPFVLTAQFVVTFVEQLRASGIAINHIDFGGGMGVRYFNAIHHEGLPKEDPAHDKIPEPADVIAAVAPLLRSTHCSLWLEPGRSILANAGVLLTRVAYIKDSGQKKFVIVDAGMTDLLRPSLYNAHHQIAPVAIETYEHELVDVVGPICETGDFFARNRTMNRVKSGDVLAVLTAGAYGFVNTSHYNGRPRPAEVLVNGERVRVIRQRETFEDLL
ncbi:MAG: diaminopimelate decarboxylase [Ignavibacteriales bacterium]|nr:diaminopimelate decarboxylase [Ignavibacteriales bacterium]